MVTEGNERRGTVTNTARPVKTPGYSKALRSGEGKKEIARYSHLVKTEIMTLNKSRSLKRTTGT